MSQHQPEKQKRHMIKMTYDKKGSADGSLDLTQFVRSIQRIEGRQDCFARTAAKECNRTDCQWHCYCLKELQKE